MGNENQSGKHTPGPWLIERYCDGTMQVCGDLLCVDDDNEVYSVIVEALTPGDQAEANAALIAAAPDLLSALEKVVTRLEANLDDEREMGRGSMTYLLEVCAPAVARARGLSQ